MILINRLRTKLSEFAGWLSVAILAFSAVTSAAAEDAPPPLLVGDQLGGAKTVMQAAGVLNDVPYRIDWSNFAAAAPLLEALNAGAIDIGGVGDAPFMFAFAAHAPIKAVGAYRYDGAATALLVGAASPVRSLSDLKGHTIGTVRGSIGHFLALKAIDRAGLQRSEVTLRFLTPPDARAALSTGAIDAWSTWGQYIGMGLLDDHAKILLDGQGIMSGLGYEVATDQAISAKRAQITDFVARLAEARRWGLAHPDDYARVWAAETHVSLDVAAWTLKAQAAVALPIDDKIIAQQQATADYYVGAGVVMRPVDVAPGFDRSFTRVSDPGQ
jgi:sulfonate transport system substrate-binding protein